MFAPFGLAEAAATTRAAGDPVDIGTRWPDVAVLILTAGLRSTMHTKLQQLLDTGAVSLEELAALERSNAGRRLLALVRDMPVEPQRCPVESRVRQLADSAPVLVWQTDEQGAVFMNQAYRDFVGMPLDALLGMGWSSALHPDDAAAYLATYCAAFGRQERFEAQFRFRRADGQYRWMKTVGLPRFEQGRFIGYVGSTFDISDAKAAEQALTDADRRKDEFLATLAHELRNPLAPLQTGIDLIRGGASAPAASEALEMMQRQLSALVHLIDDLLDVSRIVGRRIHLRPERLDLNDVLRQARETVQASFDAGAQRLSLALADVPVPVDGDAVRLTQVFTNLLSNAARYSATGGHTVVRIGLPSHDTRVLVTVEDQGIGIPANQLGSAFRLFSPVDRDLGRPSQGLGVGLWLSRELVMLHGGRLWASSQGSGLGSTFFVELPLAPPREQASEPASAPPAAAPCVSEPLRVVIVDDNVDAARALHSLVALMGHTPALAHTGESALVAAQVHRPHVMLVDIGLPDMDGYEVARRLRLEPSLAALRLVALTGWGSPQDKRKALEAGFDHHLTKPARAMDIEAALSREPARRQ